MDFGRVIKLFSPREGFKLVGIYLFLSFLILSCASTPPKKESIEPGIPLKEIETSKQVRAMNEKILLGALTSKRDLYRDYRIGPEDLLEISVFEEEKLNRTVRVSSQGNISLPLLGILRVKGLTPYELEKEIRDLLAERYLQNPHVTVFIKEYRSQRISVIGAVEKPGVFEVAGPKTILEALGMAGGLKEDAGQFLFLIRPPPLGEEGLKKGEDPQAETIQTFVINLEDLLIRGDLNLNLSLSHGDVLNIPVSGKVFVGGEVVKPGGFPLKGKRVTVSQAIAMAEGLKPEANGSEAKIFRYSGKGNERETITVNLYAVQKGKAEDIYLIENDIVIVPKSGIKTFLIGLRDTLKGLIGFGVSLGTL